VGGGGWGGVGGGGGGMNPYLTHVVRKQVTKPTSRTDPAHIRGLARSLEKKGSHGGKREEIKNDYALEI